MWNAAKEFFFGVRKTDREIKTELASQQALSSHEAFMMAASSTMMLAQDVTATLKGRIDDYSRQIEATSFVLGDALFMVDHTGVIETFNPAAETIFGCSADSAVGKSISELFKLDGTTFMRVEELVVAFSAPPTVGANQRALSLRSRILGTHSAGHHFQVEVSISNFTRSDDSLHYLLLVRDMDDERAAEAQVLTLSQKQQAILSAMPDIVCTFNEHYQYTSMWSPSEGYRQHDPEDCLGRSVYEVLPFEKAKEFATLINQVRNGEYQRTEMFSLKTDGSAEQTYSLRFSMCGDEVLMVARNVTDIKKTEDELQESIAHFRAFGQASNEAMLIHDDNEILSFNPRLSEMTGYSSKEIMQMSPLDFVYPLEREKIISLQQEMDLARSYDTLYLTKDGLVLEVSINAKPVEWKNKRARIKVIRDITHLKDFEQILNISRERYRTISDNTVDLVCYYDAQLNIKFTNQTFKDYFDNKDPKNFLDFVHAEDAPQVLAHASSVSSEQPVRRTLHRVLHGDSIRWQDWIDRAVFDAEGQLIEIQGVGRDVTDYVSRFRTT